MKREENPKFESTLFIRFKIFFIVIAGEGGDVRLTHWVVIVCSEQ